MQELPQFCIDPANVGEGEYGAYEVLRDADGEIVGRRRVAKFVAVWRDEKEDWVDWAVVQWEEQTGFELVRDVGVDEAGEERRLYTPGLEAEDKAGEVSGQGQFGG